MGSHTTQQTSYKTFTGSATSAWVKGSRELSRGQTYVGFLRGGACQGGDFQGGDCCDFKPSPDIGGFSGSGICGVWRVSNLEVGFDLLPYIVDLAENLT